MMRAELIIIENEQDLVEAQAMIAALGTTEDPAEGARLRAQAMMLAAYEAEHWQTARATPADIGRYPRLCHGSARSRPGRHAADFRCRYRRTRFRDPGREEGIQPEADPAHA